MRQLLMLIFICFMCSSWQMGKDERDITLKFNRKKYQIRLPKDGFSLSEYKYAEGIYKTYYYGDSSLITIYLGSNMHRPMLKEPEYILTDSARETEFIVRRGVSKNSNRYWQEMSTHEILFRFNNVRKSELQMFENAFKEIKITSYR